MSEYQYYEFAALDQPLSKQQQAELRALSSRAVITASGFRNEYHWGDLKGDPHDWMKRYFDAHVYSAGWASCSFMLRLPGGMLDKAALADYAADAEGGAFSAAAAGSYCILDWSFDDDSGDAERFYDEQDGPGWMARLLPLREELLRGDMRPLYLGWLARLCACELDDDELEPPLPAGLGALSPAQSALAEFLELDPDLLAAAAAASAAPPARGDALRACTPSASAGWPRWRRRPRRSGGKPAAPWRTAPAPLTARPSPPLANWRKRWRRRGAGASSSKAWRACRKATAIALPG